MPDLGADRVELLGEIFANFVRESLCQEVIDGLKQHSVSYTHYEVLRIAIARPGSTVGEVAKLLKVGYPKATQLVNRLHQLGLVSKRGVRSDRRIAKVFATPKGEDFASCVAAERGRRMESVMKRMRAAERETFRRSLEEFLVAADKSGIMKEPFGRVGLSSDTEDEPSSTDSARP